MKIATIIGARPQFIKSACVSRELAHQGIEEVIIHTGQHFDEAMSEVFFKQMELRAPRHFLDIHSLPHGAMTGRMLEGIEAILMSEKPDFVMVYGDTNSTLAGALAGAKLQIPIVHVEAGLRSFDNRMPEEMNRILTDRVSSLLLTPSQKAKENLLREGFASFECVIEEIGDVMLDSALAFRGKARAPQESLPDSFILCTLHRQENSDNEEQLKRFVEILDLASEIANVVVPLHPRTKARLEALRLAPQSARVHFIKPVGYLEMLWLLERALVVMTDSGGLQKEAYFFGKMCLILRDSTEWVELLERGHHLTGLNKEKIIETLHNCAAEICTPDLSIYGAGNASKKAVEAIRRMV